MENSDKINRSDWQWWMYYRKDELILYDFFDYVEIEYEGDIQKCQSDLAFVTESAYENGFVYYAPHCYRNHTK